MPRVFWMKMSCMKVFSMTYFIQINFIKNDLNKKCYTVLTHQNQATPTVSFGFGKQTQKEKRKTP